MDPGGESWSQDCLDSIQKKINYANIDGNYNLSDKVVGKSKINDQPIIVFMSNKE